MHRLRGILLLSLLLPFLAAADMASAQSNDEYVPYKKPYSMAPTTSSVKILWQMSDEKAPTEAVVRYGKSRNKLDMEVWSSDGWNVADEGFVHIVTLTGLDPFTHYYYTIGDSIHRYTDTCSTKTAPERGTAFRIFTISDIHGNSKRNWQNMQDTICALQPDIAIMNGDFVSDNGADRRWNKYFFNPGEQFLSQVPIMSSVGNHETGVPETYRWSSFYDYFHQFSHGISEDSIKDPRGEAYFHFAYGNADFIMLNINGDASSPDFLPGSKQYNWADSMLNACDRPWIIVCHHVGMWTSGYHGQWSAYPKRFAPLLEKYAAQGKHIISLSGDDHSFEHLYKDGVHYVRPGCGRDANYAQQTQLIDYQYSLFYRKVSCWSILDFTADASHIDLTACDSVGNVFYTYRFQQDGSDRLNIDKLQNQNTQTQKQLINGTLMIHRANGQLFSVVGTPIKRINLQ
ncbi:MAG: metallophosphoesterase family protein [Paludibacteraceae bacterium]|nr:metallophosphoesterase family protein [Paludibacteraceae bacterium]